MSWTHEWVHGIAADTLWFGRSHNIGLLWFSLMTQHHLQITRLTVWDYILLDPSSWHSLMIVDNIMLLIVWNRPEILQCKGRRCWHRIIGWVTEVVEKWKSWKYWRRRHKLHKVSRRCWWWRYEECWCWRHASVSVVILSVLHLLVHTFISCG